MTTQSIIIKFDDLFSSEDDRPLKEVFKTFRTYYAAGGKSFLIREDDYSVMIEFDPYNDEHAKQLKLEGVQLERLSNNSKASSTAGVVPKELENKFCVIFGGNVYQSYDTYEEAKAYMDECEFISWTLYVPPTHVDKSI
jgi:hypothetical protein